MSDLIEKSEFSNYLYISSVILILTEDYHGRSQIIILFNIDTKFYGGTMYKDLNQVQLCGTILNMYIPQEKPMRMILTLKCGNNNYPKVFITDHLAQCVSKGYKTGDRIGVIGNMQSSNKKVGTVTTIFVTEIFKPKSDIEDQNYFILAGEIVGVKTFTDSNICRILIKTTIMGRESVTPVTFYQPDPRLFWAVSDNPTIMIGGNVQTTKRKSGNKFNYFQNFVADFPKG